MKPSNAAVIALLNAGALSYYTSDIYALTTVNGPVALLTTADFDVLGPPASALGSATTSGFTTVYSCGSIGSGSPKIDLKQSKVQGHWIKGLDADQWQVALLPTTQDPFTGAYTYPDVIGGTPWMTACQAGLFDGAAVQVARAYWAAAPTVPFSAASRTCVGVVQIFAGLIGNVDCNETICVLTLNDYRYLLSTSIPRNLIMPACKRTLFDSRCNNAGALPPASFQQSGTALAGSTQQNVVATPPAPTGSGSYTQGRMLWTSGANNTFSRTIAAWDGVKNFQPQIPWFFPVSAGDTFSIWPGCDKSLGAGGCGGFNNTANYGGMPFVPVPEITIGG